LLINYKYYYLT